MKKVAQIYRESLAALTELLRHGDRDIDELVTARRQQLMASESVTPSEIDQALVAVQRDLEEFTRSYQEVRQPESVSDAVYTRDPRESVERASGHYR